MTIIALALLGVVAVVVLLRRPAVRFARTLVSLARDERLPRKYKVALAIGLLPILGPLDELLLVCVGVAVAVRYRPLFVEHWRKA